MNELQQVLLIFAVVVIAGLYFLSRSRQNAIKKSSEQKPKQAEQSVHTVSHSISDSEKAAEALNNLGNPHIPLSESTEKRITEGKGLSNSELKQEIFVNNQPVSSVDSQDESINVNQGVLSFGEEFDIPAQTSATTPAEQAEFTEADSETNIATTAATTSSPEQSSAGKHHVLVVDDPGMVGEIDESTVTADFVKPSFGIPAEELATNKKMASTNKEPEVYVIMVMSTGQEFPMSLVNQALLGVGLTYSDQGIFVKNDNMGNAFIKVANMLEPGTFPLENLDGYVTPGVALILELPTTVRAPAAMHDLIIMARKISQKLNARLYDMQRHLIKESDLQSMRDAALDYESEPIA
ncbi:MAG: cell division protein ZipA C-terminal FtsZ-binding domain-containing protein [Pseudomonadota bacterium]|nr:cell division protein ZipA C-terminal FtsZ-binding domain-containing protein [Pseudomonadota bacterium]